MVVLFQARTAPLFSAVENGNNSIKYSVTVFNTVVVIEDTVYIVKM